VNWGDVADQVTSLTVGFVVTNHPHLGYRMEERVDLESVYATDILQGAFMGDAILRLPGADFSTTPRNSGWRGLVEWCLALDATIRGIGQGTAEQEMSVSDPVESIQIRRDGQDLVLSRGDVVGRVAIADFTEHIEAFIRESVTWINDRYPAAKRNPAARAYWEQLDAYLAT
jgi:hypothetical protein